MLLELCLSYATATVLSVLLVGVLASCRAARTVRPVLVCATCTSTSCALDGRARCVLPPQHDAPRSFAEAVERAERFFPPAVAGGKVVAVETEVGGERVRVASEGAWAEVLERVREEGEEGNVRIWWVVEAEEGPQV